MRYLIPLIVGLAALVACSESNARLHLRQCLAFGYVRAVHDAFCQDQHGRLVALDVLLKVNKRWRSPRTKLGELEP